MKPSLKLIGAICLLFIAQAILEGFFMTCIEEILKIKFNDDWGGSWGDTLLVIFHFWVLVGKLFIMSLPYIIIMSVICYWNEKPYLISYFNLIVNLSIFLCISLYTKSKFDHTFLNPFLGIFTASIVLIIIEKKYPQLFAGFYEK